MTTLKLTEKSKLLCQIISRHVLHDRKTRVLLVVFFILVIISKYLEACSIDMAGQLVNCFQSKDISIRKKYALTYVFLNFFSFITHELLCFMFSKPVQRTMRTVMLESFKYFLDLGYQRFNKIGTAEIYAIIDRKGNAAYDIVDVVFFECIPAFFSIFFAFIFLSGDIGTYIPSIMVIFFVMFLGLTFYITEKRTKIRKKLNEKSNFMSNRMYDTLLNYDTVLAYENRDIEVSRLDEALKGVEKYNVMLLRSLFILNLAQRTVFLIQMIVILLLGAHFYLVKDFNGKICMIYMGFARSLANYLFKSGYLYGKFSIGLLNYSAANKITEKYNLKEKNSKKDQQKEQKSGEKSQFDADSSDTKSYSDRESDLSAGTDSNEEQNDALETIRDNNSAPEEENNHVQNVSKKTTAPDIKLETVHKNDMVGASIRNNGKRELKYNLIPESAFSNASAALKFGSDRISKGPAIFSDKNQQQNISETDQNVSVNFNDVSIFHGSRCILDKISFSFHKGETIAVVGRNGIGKSSLLKALLGFTKYEGQIFVNKKNIQDLSMEEIRSQISYIHQDSAIFNDTVLYNIKYGNPKSTIDDVLQVTKRLQIHDDILRLKLGYETICGERGSNLSGGERQKIAFARAEIKNTQIILLDEPTASLDKKAETKLLNKMFDLVQNRKTLIMVLHNLSFLKYFDKIVFLSEKEKYREIGSYDHLISKNSDFKKFCTQMG